jgi:hypothetical protein
VAHPAIGKFGGKASNKDMRDSDDTIDMESNEMNTAPIACAPTGQSLKQQLIASIAGGNRIASEELQMLLKLRAPETPGSKRYKR